MNNDRFATPRRNPLPDEVLSSAHADDESGNKRAPICIALISGRARVMPPMIDDASNFAFEFMGDFLISAASMCARNSVSFHLT